MFVEQHLNENRVVIGLLELPTFQALTKIFKTTRHLASVRKNPLVKLQKSLANFKTNYNSMLCNNRAYNLGSDL